VRRVLWHCTSLAALLSGLALALYRTLRQLF
jgi:hypothetical protein